MGKNWENKITALGIIWYKEIPVLGITGVMKIPLLGIFWVSPSPWMGIVEFSQTRILLEKSNKTPWISHIFPFLFPTGSFSILYKETRITNSGYFTSYDIILCVKGNNQQLKDLDNTTYCKPSFPLIWCICTCICIKANNIHLTRHIFPWWKDKFRDIFCLSWNSLVKVMQAVTGWS